MLTATSTLYVQLLSVLLVSLPGKVWLLRDRTIGALAVGQRSRKVINYDLLWRGVK